MMAKEGANTEGLPVIVMTVNFFAAPLSLLRRSGLS
jgi:hypothetical protein